MKASNLSFRRSQALILWDLLVAAGTDAAALEELASLPPALQPEFKDMCIHDVTTREPATVHLAISNVGAWREWCTSSGIAWAKPLASAVALFLSQRKRSGATVGQGIRGSFLMLQDVFGLELHCDSKRVRAAAAVTASHEERQAIPLEPAHVWEFSK